MEKLNDVLYAGIKGNYKCNIEYTFFEHQLHTELIDLRVMPNENGDII